MKKYKVEITETLKRIVEVEAINKLHAMAKVKDDYDDEKSFSVQMTMKKQDSR